MKNDETRIEIRPQQSPRHAVVWALVLSSMISTPVMSAPTDISPSPITSTNAAQVKPNIMLLMDTSYSMGWSHMPDEVERDLGFGSIGYKAAQCNVLYYKSAQTYLIPKRADGSFFPTPSFTAAPYDAFKTPASANVDLSNAFKAYDDFTLRTSGDNDTPQSAYYYYKTGGTVPITGYASSPCFDADPGLINANGTPASSDGGVWNRVVVGAGEQANFAIWYSYYRTRILLIKSAASLAFTPLTDSFRVGFITVNPKDNSTVDAPINAAKYLPIDDFGPVQRGLWFDKLFAQRPFGSSPTREGLARVGRHYAGAQDGINQGMTGDPVQFSCQQNFTIMTTDGYWNGQDESTNMVGGYLGGGVDISGKTLVGQRDGNYNAPSTNNPSPPPAADVNVTPRPIWDGQFDGVRTIRSKNDHYEYLPCGTYFNMTTTTLVKSTSQLQRQTVQTTQSSDQNLQSTSQNLRSTLQTLRSTSQPTRSTFQRLKSTNQNLASSTQRVQTTAQTTQSTIQRQQTTNQNLQTTLQNLQSSLQEFETTTRREETVWIPQQSTAQNLQSTTQTLRSTAQQNEGTVQILQSTQQNSYTATGGGRNTSQTTEMRSQTFQSTAQNLQSTSQTLRRTSQVTRSRLQNAMTTSQLSASTSQIMLTTSQTTTRTTQDASCDARGENCVPTPAGSCVSGGGVTCETRTTGPTLVVYNGCTNVAAAAPTWRATICNTVTQPAIPAAACTFDPASGGNSYTTTTCNTVAPGPTLVANCTNIPAAYNNAYTATTCTNVATGPTFVLSCTPSGANSGNSYTATSCSTPVNDAPVGVQTCAPQTPDNTNNYLAINCTPNNTPNTPVQTCAGSAGDGTNSWVTTTCTPATTTSVPVLSCTTSGPLAGNSWTDTTCATNNSVPAAVQTCSPIAAAIGNSYTATLCAPTSSSSPSGTCAPVTAFAGNSWTEVTCPTVTTSVPLVVPGACTPAVGDGTNSWTTTTCPTTTSGPIPLSGACFADYVMGFYTYRCTPNNTTDVPVAACNPSGPTSINGWTTTTCRSIVSALTPTASCSPVSPVGPAFIATVCPILTTTDVGVDVCVANPTPDNTNSYTSTTCRSNNTSNVPVASCANATRGPGNSWLETICSTNNTSNVAVSSCLASSPTNGNGYTTTTCPPEILFSGPTVVGSCTPDPATAGNGYHRTDCATIVTNVPRQAGTCVPDIPNGITCTTSSLPNVPVATCTPQTADVSNNWIEITCSTNNNFNVPVSACTASGPNAGNLYTTTSCPAAIMTGPTFVASCTVTAAAGGNSWTSTGCPAPITTGPTGVQTCAFIPGDAMNNWQTTTCGSAGSTMPVQTCVGAPADGANSWTATSCVDNNQINQPVTACAPQTAALGNGWTTITCPSAVVTTDVPSASCVDDPFAGPGNSYTTTTCRSNDVLNVPDGSCSPISPNGTNNYTTTTCPTLTSVPAGASACSAQTGDGTNSWLTVTCTPNNTTDVGVLTCANSSADGTNGYTTTSCRVATTTDVAVPTCSAGGPTGGNFYVTSTCRVNSTSRVPTQTCTPISPDLANGYTTTTCPVLDSGVIGAPSCSAGPPTMANFWTTTTCPGTATTGPTASGSCVQAAADISNSYTATTCGTVTSTPSVVTSCNASPPNAGNGYVGTTCAQIFGKRQNTTTTSRVQVFNVSGGRTTTVISDNTTVVGPTPAGVCHAPGSEPALPADGPPSWTGADATTYPTCTGWPCTTDVGTNDPRSINSLADVAQYYYVTDLRTAANEPRGINFYRDDVPGVGSGDEDDRVAWQHMTTFSIALGVSGTLRYRSDYKTAATGDFAEIRTGPRNWPLWPDPAINFTANATLYNDPRSIDDFWHAAVNGRGTYFSASDPTSVIAGLAGALAGITSRVASSSGAATSNLEPVAGDNFAYLASYSTQKWTGDVQAHEIDIATGQVLPAIVWSARTLLNATTYSACDNRRIMLFRAGATDNLTDFSWNSQACDLAGNPAGAFSNGLNATERLNFASANVQLLSQWPTMTDGTGPTPNQRALAADANLVNFLRGQRGLENYTSGDAAKLYRSREHVLGDVVNGQPTYVRAPFASYSDAGYTAFKAANSARTPMLYVAANDGMLHAFYAGTSTIDPQGGKEAWAIIPSTMLTKLYKLADANYKNIHEYFVDGTPTVSDVYDGSAWKTMLVGGLNDGGRSYYAIDVTVPTAPKGMWEFNWSNTCYDVLDATTAGADCHLGKTFGKPLITKLADGRWVVMVTSGYNNVNATPKVGDGVGYLYVLNAVTGKILYKIPTNVGDSTTPSGLAQINNYVEKADIDNTTVRVYGTDVVGNIWRFDVNNNTPPNGSGGREATLLATARDGANNPQPITVRPELTQLGGKPMIFVATGKLLGATDSSDVQTQSIYGIVDPVIGTTAFANLRSALAPLRMTQVGSGPGAYRTVSCIGNAAACGSADGWYIDLPDSGERTNVEMKLRAQTLVVGTNVPRIGACVAGGYSWLNFLDYKSGLAVTGAPNQSISISIANELIVGLTVIIIGSGGGGAGTGDLKGIVTTSGGNVLVFDIPKNTPVLNPKRISWREVVTP